MSKTSKTSKAHDHSKYSRWIDPNEVVPYEKNAKQHTEKQINNIANSINRFGWQQDVVITADNVLVIGHGRRLAALKIGCQMPYHVIDKKADELTEEDIRELRIADNQTNAETGFDFDLLAEDLEGLDFSGFDFDFNVSTEQDSNTENPYTSKTSIPQYEITGEQVELDQLVEKSKAESLIEEIESSDIDSNIKDFLIIAAYRHVYFNYQKIAEYYANALPDVQRLMEKSALVIIDIDDAIANGYTLLKDSIADIVLGDDYDE